MPHPSGRPWIIAHRGASLRARENTIEAFRLAVDLGADSVELDIRRTADDVLVVHHDATVAGAARPIVAMSRADLAAAAPWVPDLESVLVACHDIWVDVEIKNDPREPDWDPDHHVARALADSYGEADIVATSFNPDTIAVVRAAGLRTGWLLGRGIDPADAASEAAVAGHEFLLPHHTKLVGADGPRIIDAARAAGVEVAVWTVDQPNDMIRLARLGVGGICSNAPEIASSTLLAEYGDGEHG